MPTLQRFDPTDPRIATTLAMLADRLPDYTRVSFPALWEDVKGLRGIVGRDTFYDLLTALDGAHLSDDGLLVRIRHNPRAARRAVLVRVRRTPEEQRAYLRRYLARGRVHPPHPVSYKTAHARVRAERGPASDYYCNDCEERASEWAYGGSSPDQQIGFVSTSSGRAWRAWSPVPSDYLPLCRRCHHEFDAAGIVWGIAPLTPSPIPVPEFIPDDPPVCAPLRWNS